MAWVLRPIELVGDDGGPDVDAAYAVVLAHESALGHPTPETRESVLGRLRSMECVPEGSELAFDADGTCVGATLMLCDPNSRTVAFNPCTLPEAADRDGLSDLLLARAIERARAIAAASGVAGWNVTCRQIDSDAHYTAALERAGLSRVRHFLRMHIDLTSDTVETASWPEGVTVVTSPDDSDLREMHDVLEEAFSDHWDYHPWPFDDWIADVTVTPEFVDRDLWWLLRADGRSAAAVISDLSRTHLGDLYVRELGVRRAYRGRGLARSILLHAFAEARRRGLSGAQLGVDADSLTDAVRLYESVGMRVTHHMVLWRLELDG